MNKKSLKTLGKLTGAVAGTAVLLGGGSLAGNAPLCEDSVVYETDAGVTVENRARESFNKVANVMGEFSFDQNVLSPSDEVFNIFGTALTGICAKPGFAYDKVDRENYFINVKGNLKKSYSLSLDQLMQRENSQKIITCSCATSPAIANARVTGVPLADVLSLAEMGEGVNTVTVRSQDGYGLAMPLSYALEKEGMLVWNVNNTTLTDEIGGPVQLWMPDTVARYFTRQVFEIELSAQESIPALQSADARYRAKVAFVNRVNDETFAVGTQIVFEGYADDCGKAVRAVEFSMDGGETWTSCDTSKATAGRWIYWNFGYTANETGTYKLEARARCEDGTVSPLAANIAFTVTENARTAL